MRRRGAKEPLERLLVGERRERAEELQAALRVRLGEQAQHLAPEQAPEHVDVHEEVRLGRDPLATHRSDSPPPGTIMCTCG